MAAVAAAAAAVKAVERQVVEKRAVASEGEVRPVGAARAMEVAAAAVVVATAEAASEVVRTVEDVVEVPEEMAVAKAVMAEAGAEGGLYSCKERLCLPGTEARFRDPCIRTRCQCPPPPSPCAQSCCIRRSDPTTSS